MRLLHLSIVTDEISQDLEHALRVCRDLDIDTVELRVIAGKNIVFHDEDSLQHIKSLLDSQGFRVCVIDTPFLKSHFWGDAHDQQAKTRSPYSADFDPAERQWEILGRSFVLARRFGAPLVRTFSFWRFPEPAAVREEVLAIIAEAVRRTEAAGLKLAIENEHACNVATGAEVGWLFQHIPSQSFGSLWDPGNEAAVDSDPFPQGYSHVRGRVFHMHVKDWSPQHRKFVKMGIGSIDYVNQFRAMAEDGYDGILSLETHYTHPEGGKELATRESCEALRRILQEAGVKLT